MSLENTFWGAIRQAAGGMYRVMPGLQILLEIVRETEDFHKAVHYLSNSISTFVSILGRKCELKQQRIKINLA